MIGGLLVLPWLFFGHTGVFLFARILRVFLDMVLVFFSSSFGIEWTTGACAQLAFLYSDFYSPRGHGWPMLCFWGLRSSEPRGWIFVCFVCLVFLFHGDLIH